MVNVETLETLLLRLASVQFQIECAKQSDNAYYYSGRYDCDKAIENNLKKEIDLAQSQS